MLIGRVVGSLVASQKDPQMEGFKLLVLQRVGIDATAGAGYVVAVDAVGAGEDEFVLYASGSSARQTERTRDKPCDAVVMAIVDSWDVDGREVYKK